MECSKRRENFEGRSGYIPVTAVLACQDRTSGINDKDSRVPRNFPQAGRESACPAGGFLKRVNNENKCKNKPGRNSAGTDDPGGPYGVI
jgi:hypothetical protein